MRFYRESNLEDMCLNVIVDNFNSPFYNHEKFRKGKEFLQRHYTSRIYNLLESDGIVTDEYINWLISPYWKDVVIGKTHILSKFSSKLIIYGKGISSISFGNSATTVETLSAVICLVPNVKSIDLSCTNCNDDLLLLIRKFCPNLAILDIGECNVTNVGMENLCHVNREKVGFESLKLLNLKGSRVEDAGVKYVLRNLNLHVLKYPSLVNIMFELSSSCIRISDFKALKYTDEGLTQSHYLQSSIDILEMLVVMCPNLERFAIYYNLTETHLNLLLKFQKLKCLVINFKDCTLSVSQFLTLKGDKLTELELVRTCVSVEIITKYCRNLRTLFLNDVEYEDFDEANVTKSTHCLNNLIDLKIANADFSLSGPRKSIRMLLNSCMNIQSLYFRNIRRFCKAFSDIIVKMPYLVDAVFLLVQLTRYDVQEFFASKNIVRLNLDGCPSFRVIDCNDCVMRKHSERKINTFQWQVSYQYL